LKAKTGSSKAVDIRYKPIDETLYPVQVVDGEMFYWRIWCRENFIVYEKYKNNVKLGFVIFPGGKELFHFTSMVSYAESIKTTGEVVCVRGGD
jgi:hypothetical protein